MGHGQEGSMNEIRQFVLATRVKFIRSWTGDADG